MQTLNETEAMPIKTWHEKQFITTEELANRWQCSKMHIYRLVEGKKINAVKIGKLLRFATQDICDYEMQQATKEAV